MEGSTQKLTHPDYATQVRLSSGEVLATRRDGGPHRIFSSEAIAAAWLGKPLPWETGRTRHSDDNWPATVKFNDVSLATARALSLKTYGPPDAMPPAADEEPAAAQH